MVNTGSVTVGGTIACNEFLTSNGTFKFTSPYVGTLNVTSQQVSESAVISMTTADGKNAGLTHYSDGHAKGQLLDIFAQPGLQMSLSPGGVEAVRINTTGLVGIGTTSPTGMVHIKSNASDKVSLLIAGAVSQTANFLEMRNSSNVLWASYRRPEATDPGAGSYIGLKNRIYDVGGTYYMDLYQSDLYSTIAPSSYFVIHSGNTNNTSSLILRNSTDVVWHISGVDGSGDIYPGYDYTNSRGPRIYAGSRFGFYINGTNAKQDWVKDDRINSTNGRVMFMAQVAGADTDICSMSGDGLNLQSGKALYNAGNKVVGARGAAVANANDLESALTQLNALLARLRDHGLISE